MKFNGRLILFTFALLLLATACKFFFGPELAWSGFSPVIAIALFSGFMIRQRDMSFLLPLLVLFISDAVIQLLYAANYFPYEGFYSGQWKNYLLLIGLTLAGWALKGRSHARLVVGAILSPTIYFLASNFLVWRATTEAVYAKSFGGLMNCYEAGLPFYRNSIIATLVFLPAILLYYNFMINGKARLRLA